jgi:acyl dehydratase
LAAILELVPESVFAAARGGVHGRHELLLHRPITPGEKLHTLVETHSARNARDNLRVTLLHRTYDSTHDLVAEQWWTTVMLGVSAEETGPDLPVGHGTADDRERPDGEEIVRIDQEMARRYAEVSGDFSAHHFDAEAARRSGFAHPFLHGLCTMALCARAVVLTACPEDPGRVQRIAVQFASPAYLDQELAVRVWHVGEGRYAFEATSGEARTIRNGLAEVGCSDDAGGEGRVSMSDFCQPNGSQGGTLSR